VQNLSPIKAKSLKMQSRTMRPTCTSWN